MRKVYKNLCPATITASIMAVNMWKNSLKNVESDKNKILYETLLSFLQRNGTYFLNKPRNKNVYTKDKKIFIFCIIYCTAYFIFSYEVLLQFPQAFCK